MGNYIITFAKSARKELEALDAIFVDRILSKIESLAFDPRRRGWRCEIPISGYDEFTFEHNYNADQSRFMRVVYAEGGCSCREGSWSLQICMKIRLLRLG
ncbi:MAG: hypothetical protein KKG06_06205 [Bacteroidetes bacterium]|nr:hypothetical protein [Bacteroidota bacterium]MBU1422760.1 hypothetical protein [Bacteroidota bacterium]